MLDLQETPALADYLNPVYPKSFPDPFVLKFRDEYFAYCTGFADSGDVFGVLRSRDLVTWDEVGCAMKPLANSPPYYWAPEVIYDNGKFYLYYSVGNETLMEIRVAVSSRPDGGFVDSGERLTHEEFAIDAHIFVDDDGSKYFFYATDFLEHTHIGTGTVVDRMIDWFTLEGAPRPVTRAKYDWQVYDPKRKEKGGVRWHTVEGPAVLKRKGRYYEMFSGGNWQNTSYGVSFAISDSIEDPDEWKQFSDGKRVLPILRTHPDLDIVGPGHNCIVAGPNNRELYCVYHRWTARGRVMAIDRMDFAGDRIFVIGPSHTRQPAPFRPSLSSLESASTAGWTVDGQSARSRPDGDTELEFEVPSQSFLTELHLQCDDPVNENGKLGLRITADGKCLVLTFHPFSNTVRIEVPEESPGFPTIFKLADSFEWRAEQRLLIDADHCRLKIRVGSTSLLNTYLPEPIAKLALFSRYQSAAVTSFVLTNGFEELFEDAQAFTENGWNIAGDAQVRIEKGELLLESAADHTIRKGPAYSSFEYAANFRTLEEAPQTGEFGVVLEHERDEFFRLSIDAEGSAIKVNGHTVHVLQDDIEISNYHQLRTIKIGGRVLCYFDDVLLGEYPVSQIPVSAAAFSNGIRTAIEMIRLTAI